MGPNGPAGPPPGAAPMPPGGQMYGNNAYVSRCQNVAEVPPRNPQCQQSYATHGWYDGSTWTSKPNGTGRRTRRTGRSRQYAYDAQSRHEAADTQFNFWWSHDE